MGLKFKCLERNLRLEFFCFSRDDCCVDDFSYIGCIDDDSKSLEISQESANWPVCLWRSKRRLYGDITMTQRDCLKIVGSSG